MAVNVGSAVGYLDLDITGFLDAMKKAKDEGSKLPETLSEKIGNKMQDVGKILKDTGKIMSVGLTTPIVGFGASAIKTAADFESAMSKVKAISGETDENVGKLEEKAKSLGKSTKFSATEVSEGFGYMAMAGWDAEKMLSGIDGVLMLATADGLDLATTTDIVTDAMTAFGMSAEETNDFVNILAATGANANTNVAMLGESFKYVAPVAGALGYNAKDTALALGLMANSGIKASQGGTALRTMLTNLAKPTKAVQNAMDELGISITNDDGSMKSLEDVMGGLRTAFGESKIPAEELQSKINELSAAYENGTITEKDYNEEVERLYERAYGAEGALKAQYAASIAGKEGMSGLLSIVNATEEDYGKLKDSIYNANDAFGEGIGAAEGMANIMKDNLNGRITELKSAFEGLQEQIGSILIPYVEKFVEWLQKLIDKFMSLSTEQQEQIVKFAAIVAAIGPLITILGTVISVIGKVVSNFKTIVLAGDKVINAFKILWGVISANPFVAFIAILVAVGAALVTLYKKNEDFRNKVNQVFNAIKNIISTVISAIINWFTVTLPAGFNKAYNAVVNFKNKVLSTLKQMPSQVISVGKNIVQGLWNGISGAAGWLAGKVKSFASGIVSNMKSALGIHSPSTVMRDAIGKFLPPGIGEGFEEALPKTMEGIKNDLNSGIKKMQSKIEDIKLEGKYAVTEGDISFDSFGKSTGFNYFELARSLAEVMREMPIQANVNVDMKDGDIIMDGERVGRKVAPVVSRVVASGVV